jgi:hypothetical protein
MLDDFYRLKDQSEAPISEKKHKRKSLQPTPAVADDDATFTVPAWLWATVPAVGAVVGVILGLLIF